MRSGAFLIDPARLDAGEQIVTVLVTLYYLGLAGTSQLPLTSILYPDHSEPWLIVTAHLNAAVWLFVVAPGRKPRHRVHPSGGVRPSLAGYSRDGYCKRF